MSLKYINNLIKMPDTLLAKELETVSVSEFRLALIHALKEQDRETRQLCAKACMNAYSNQFNKTLLR